MDTQYIFNNYWYGQQNFQLAVTQYQTEPSGGWGNWTPQHNVDWLNKQIHERKKFVLIGELNTLIAQANNVGTGKNKSFIGVEIMILTDSGYTQRLPNSNNQDEFANSCGLRVFEPATQGALLPSGLATRARPLKAQDFTMMGPFWNDQLKAKYQLLLNFVPATKP